MDIIRLKFMGYKTVQSGSLYCGLITDELDDAFGKDSFKLCRKAGENIIRIEYNRRGVGDFMVKSLKSREVQIIKANLYLGSISTIEKLNTNANINKLYRILNSYVDKVLIN